MGSFRNYDKKNGVLEKTLYTTVAREGDLKIVVLYESESQIKPIEIANSPNSIYAIKDINGEIKIINFFDENKKKVKQIDLGHLHQGMRPHVHELNGEKYHPQNARPCNQEELDLIEKVRELAK